MSPDAIPPAGPETVTWRQWFCILTWVLAEPWRYLAGGDEQAAAARYRAACGHAPAVPAALGDLETGDLIGMRTAAWDAGETGRAETIDAGLNRRLRTIMRGRFPAGTSVSFPEPQPSTLRTREGGQ